jgi:hypothetical protein
MIIVKYVIPPEAVSDVPESSMKISDTHKTMKEVAGESRSIIRLSADLCAQLYSRSYLE